MGNIKLELDMSGLGFSVLPVNLNYLDSLLPSAVGFVWPYVSHSSVKSVQFEWLWLAVCCAGQQSMAQTCCPRDSSEHLFLSPELTCRSPKPRAPVLATFYSMFLSLPGFSCGR